MFLKLLFLSITFSGLVLAQQTGSLRGVVTDSLKGEALPFANILIEGTTLGSSADLNGYFTITGIPIGDEYSVRLSYVGYFTKTMKISIKPNTITQIQAQMVPSSIQLQAIEMIGEKMDRPNETNLGLQKLTIRELEMLPKGVETDVFRSLQYLPGVQSTGDVSARYYVRGGGSNQNLVLLNGVSVYNPFHALGLFSIIDPEMINAVEFYKGGFPSEFGGRLSSVLNLVTKDGNKNRYAGNAQVSFLTGKSAIEGPIPGGSFIVTGRKSLFKDVLKKFVNYKDAPFEFHDISAKINYSNNSEESLTKLSAHGFNSLDQLLSDDPYESEFKWVNNIYGLNWFQAWENVPIYSEAGLSLSRFDGNIDPKFSNSKRRKNKINDITFKADFTNILESRDEVKVGFLLKSVNTELDFENLQGIQTNLNSQALSIGFYTKYRLLRWDALGIDAGSRFNFITLTQKYSAFAEPRINLTYGIIPGLINLKGAYGIYTQELITVSNENEIISLFEPWVITPSYLSVPLAVHYVAGFDFTPVRNLSFSFEAYYKDLKNTAEINDAKASDNDPDFVQGSGDAYGFEFLLKQNNTFMAFTGSYSLSWSYREINNWVSFPKYDTRHIVNLHLNFEFGHGWSSSASWFFNSGLPFTQIIGYYEKLYFDDLFYSSGLPGFYSPYTILADRNLGRLPTYHRMDVSITKKFQFTLMNFEVSGSVMNLYDRKNIFYYERATGKKVNMLPILPTATVKIEI
jgi:hypothetical protein